MLHVSLESYLEFEINGKGRIADADFLAIRQHLIQLALEIRPRLLLK